MGVSVTERRDGDVVVLRLEGTWTRDSDPSLIGMITGMVQRGETKLLLDVGGVARWGSLGLGVVVRCYALAERGGGTLKLLDGGSIEPGNGLRDLLARTQLSKVLELFDDEAEAVRSFGVGDRPRPSGNDRSSRGRRD